VLLTRSPLEYLPKEAFPLDLHVLGTPPAFVLSQDQTLREEALDAGSPWPRPVGAYRPLMPALASRRDGLRAMEVRLARSSPLPEHLRAGVALIPRGMRNDGFKRTWL
jgi:hypothetical protein